MFIHLANLLLTRSCKIRFSLRISVCDTRNILRVTEKVVHYDSIDLMSMHQSQGGISKCYINIQVIFSD